MPDDLAALHARFRKQKPAETSLGIYKFVGAHRELAVPKFKGYVRDFEDCFEVLVELIRTLNYVKKDKWPQERAVQYILFPECLKTLHRGFEDTLDGYYDEAEMLHRSVFETILRIVFASCYPADWEAVLYDRDGKRSFKVTPFFRDDLKLDWVYLYSTMCRISHSKTHIHIPMIGKISRGEKHEEITLEYRFDEKYIWLPVNTSVFLLYGLLSLALALFLDDLEAAGAKAEHIQRAKDGRAILRHHILGNAKEKFQRLVPDIEMLEKVIAASKAGKDWKGLIQENGTTVG